MDQGKVAGSTKRALGSVYHKKKPKNAMLETKYLIQPRGKHGWTFRMRTPPALVNEINPHTNRPFGTEIKIGLDTRNLVEARKKRDTYLGIIRALEIDAVQEKPGSLALASWIAVQNANLDDDDRHTAQMTLEAEAKALERKGMKRADAARFYRVAMGLEVPEQLLRLLFEEYRSKRRPPLSVSSVSNLKTAEREFLEFAGTDIELRKVDRKLVRRFVDDYLPEQRNAKAPKGQGPATIAKKVTLLRGVWEWARSKEILPEDFSNPWDKQGPRNDEIDAAAIARRNYEPAETAKLFAAKAEGTALGDIIRIALLTGVRLEEIAGLACSAIDPKARWYTVLKGKSRNAARVVPLVDAAERIVKRRLKAADNKGPLFPELPLRASTGKRGGMITQQFTKLRRKVLGKETDGELAQHSFRHTWRTAAGRAGVDLRHAQVMGGWSRGNAADAVYDHGLENDQYRDMQKRVARWLRQKGYLG